MIRNLLIHLMVGYGVGSIPYGFLFGKWKGIDIRQHGSGNIGATNVWRVLGKNWGFPAFVLDFLKVPVSAVLVWGIYRTMNQPVQEGWQGDVLRAMTLVGAVCGHNYPVWLKFRGGKGVATSAGGLMTVLPWPALTVMMLWALIFWISRYVSLASLLAALVLPLAVWLEGHWTGKGCSMIFLGLSFMLSLMVFWRHRSNIQRLVNGTEHRWKRKESI